MTLGPDPMCAYMHWVGSGSNVCLYALGQIRIRCVLICIGSDPDPMCAYMHWVGSGSDVCLHALGQIRIRCVLILYA